MASDLEVAIERLTNWMRDYGELKSPTFIGDLSIVLLAANERTKKRCKWTLQQPMDPHSTPLWSTECDRYFTDMDDYCPKCGGKIETKEPPL